MHGRTSTLFLIVAILLICSCGKESANSIPSNEGQSAIHANSKMTLHWETVEDGFTVDHKRLCTNEEREALSYLTLPRHRIVDKPDSFLSWQGPASLDVDGEVWYFFLNSIYPSSGTQSERFAARGIGEFGFVNDSGEVDLQSLVSWHQSRPNSE